MRRSGDCSCLEPFIYKYILYQALFVKHLAAISVLRTAYEMLS